MKIENQTAKPPTKTENPPTKTANLQIETEKPTSDIDTMNRMLDMLQQEIEKKDITIKELQDKLEKAYIEIADLAKQAHYIAAADKTAKIIDKQQEDKVSKPIVTTAADIGNIEQGQPQKRKSIFERLFNR
jgi:predicted  nucleic acid-binding Zn-ribbon protein